VGVNEDLQIGNKLNRNAGRAKRTKKITRELLAVGQKHGLNVRAGTAEDRLAFKSGLTCRLTGSRICILSGTGNQHRDAGYKRQASSTKP
jgi:hypothetical protein